MNRAYTFVRGHPQVAVLAGILAVLLVGLFAFGSDETADEPEDVATLPRVELASVQELASDTAPLVVTGEVKSAQEAELRAEAPGELTAVSVSPGQFVGAGSVVARIDAQSERAQVAQAEAAVTQAEAALAKIEGGDRPQQQNIAEADVEAAEQNLAAAREAALDAARQAYFQAEDAVRNKLDVIFTNPQAGNADLRFSLPRIRFGDLEQRIEGGRRDAEVLLEQWDQQLAALSLEEAEDALAGARERLAQIRALLDAAGEGVNSTAFADGPIDSWRTSVAAARTQVTNTFNAISSSEQNLASRKQALASAVNQLDLSREGAQSEDVASSRAQLAQAQAGLQQAIAALERKIIRTPIAGEVSSLPVSRGDFVNSFDLIAVVANDGALIIEASVSNSTRARISQGDPVTIAGEFPGVVASVDPGLNPQTRQALVTIGIGEEAMASSELTHGDVVTATITPGDEEIDEDEPGEIHIPVRALKVLPERTVVFMVGEDGTLAAREVMVGPIIGEDVVIAEGLALSDVIVVDARGLREGEQVEVAQ